ncbi:hypothetical protein SH1V18_03290 [Vallitalea longa]|uniref:Uncharacterized protein n=1 Tax=Vallitalea longa TaxID=2936439 RepID=A0A9W5Y9H0_9FIRM|nr:hypothetical protein [Vallitalea longa]GKX27849.1 hypothetical protein SH1V18_03290 [Vallitalea longa]
MTGQEVFEITMDLIDERLDSGNISESDTVSYKVKAPSILTIGQCEIAKMLDYFSPLPNRITDLSQELEIDEVIATNLLPYFLATHLMLEEKDDVAAYFNDRYEELKYYYKKGQPASEEPIKDVYGGF